MIERMHIQITAVGKIKEQYLKVGIAEYSKRLRPYCRLDIVEVHEEKLPQSPSEKEVHLALESEAKAISDTINTGSLVVVLDVRGSPWTSEEFAHHLSAWEIGGENRVSFVIGGSMGVSIRLCEDADIRLSLSPMTLTHQMSRLILLEQIYRAFRICRGEPYHK